jgi:hypothetical protein
MVRRGTPLEQGCMIDTQRRGDPHDPLNPGTRWWSRNSNQLISHRHTSKYAGYERAELKIPMTLGT